MSNFHRRDFLTGAAAIAAGMTAGLVGTRQVEAGDPSFMNNVPDPLLSGKDLPTFKFALEKPAALFEKFPHQDVFIADKDGK
ncbi:MAG TPA: twin-arginine translocation signal domain-containing protein [Gemmataceae bacterium]|jgi:oxalate decarboxylase|nr:twin-arginine translocation signal domain-containing protein [Gemmataceae bacterium]